MVWRGVFRIKGVDGAPDRARITDDDFPRDVDLAEDDYLRRLLQPDWDDLPWRDVAPVSNDFTAASPAGMRIVAIENHKALADQSGSFLVVWRRPVTPKERRAYAKSAEVPSWIDEEETIFDEDVEATYHAAAAANPRTEEELAAALAGHTVHRAWETSRF